VERVLETTVWAKRHRRTLILAGAALAVLILALVYMRASSAAMRRNAETQLTQLRPTVLSGNAPLAIRDLETFLGRYGDTPTAREARVLLGRAYLENGEGQKAVDLLREQANDATDPLGVQSAMLLGAAYESLAQPANAVGVYLRVGDSARFDYQKQLALDAAARVRLETGDAAGAVELYDRILTIVPENGPDRPVYELRRAEAAARIPGGGT
jgi:tetratricopeptide (TPR) repeat protein